MAEAAVVVDRIGKKYIVGELVTVGDLKRWLLKPLRTVGVLKPGRHGGTREKAMQSDSVRSRRIERHEFWALREVSFTVSRGEVVGIIGANGAGKSTLLKILSRITAPTEGSVKLYGRVAALLEVGTGFHDELTGRENVYLNGSILGMTRSEVDSKFDEIVEFSGVEEFIDTPVKRYSSGMRVRLGFAVAAHLDPEILIVDEVLAVGDASFQRKCLGKMNDVARSGRTVLFVSHNMAAVEALCTRAVVLAKGGISFSGDTRDAVRKYLESQGNVKVDGEYLQERYENGVRIRSLKTYDSKGVEVAAVGAGHLVSFEIEIEAQTSLKARVSVGIDDALGRRIALLGNILTKQAASIVPPGQVARCTIRKLPLPPGNYYLTVQVGDADRVLVHMPRAKELRVEGGDFFGSGVLPSQSWLGTTLIEQDWEFGCAVKAPVVRGNAGS